jgi:hypothetical protein
VLCFAPRIALAHSLANQEKGRPRTGPSKGGLFHRTERHRGQTGKSGCREMGAGGFHPSTGDRVLPNDPGSDWEGGPNRKTDGTQRLSRAIFKARLLAAALPDLLRCRFGVPTEIQRRSGAEARSHEGILHPENGNGDRRQSSAYLSRRRPEMTMECLFKTRHADATASAESSWRTSANFVRTNCDTNTKLPRALDRLVLCGL